MTIETDMKYLEPTQVVGEQYEIIDIRETYEYECANIGARHIPMGDFCQRMNELPENKTWVIMCKSGKRAEALANILEVEYQRTNIAVLEGGITAWIDAHNLPLNLEP